jgi:uncharacterized damage-inducible protein DinB
VTEAWLTGPVEGVHPLLMPAAHSFLQVRDEIGQLLDGLSTAQLWQSPGQSASIGFHALHIAGATDRLLTYAAGGQLSPDQLATMKAEKTARDLDARTVIGRVKAAMDAAIEQVRGTSPETLTQTREVGRLRLPSTVLGLIFHAAEHATRHSGQISTLRRIGMP